MADTGLKRIEIDGLFGRPPFSIELDAFEPTVLTGANGTGKSTILRLLSAISNGDILPIATAPLDKLRLVFHDIAPLTMESSSGGFDLSWGEHAGRVELAGTIAELPEWAQSLLEEHDYDATEAASNAVDYAQSHGIVFSEYRRVRTLLSEHGDAVTHRVPEWLQDFGEEFPVLYVSDQRLVRESKSRRTTARGGIRRTSQLAVEAASSEVAENLQRADSDYARTSQEVDKAFPRELISAMSRNNLVTPDRLKEVAQEVVARRQRLRQVGLVDSAEEFEPEITEDALKDANMRVVIEAVLLSTLKKLSVSGDLEQRLSTFKTFLDTRFTPKQLELGREFGMRFRTASDVRVAARQLSSGEQQLTVLAYEILFRTRAKTLVIIDEPELSLHITWQDTLLADLASMSKAVSLRFLMATHSPVILAGRGDLERALPEA